MDEQDDLLNRIDLYLREMPDPKGRTFHEMQPEALLSECRNKIWAFRCAYKQQQEVWSNAIARADRYEQALAHIYAWYPISVTQPHQTIHDIREFAKNALGEKKDG
jgi:hypothetical protein